MPRDKKKRGKKKAKPARGQGGNAIAGQPPRHDEPAASAAAGGDAVDYIGTSTKGARAPPHGVCAAANNDMPDRLEQLVQKHTGGKKQQARTKQRKKKGKRAGKGAAPIDFDKRVMPLFKGII